jgi:sulfoxide reductase heme-binding subunit YedZ
MKNAPSRGRLIKAAVFLASLLPFVRLVLSGVRADLGANPIEAVTHETGLWALRFLVITLTITPFRRLTGWHSLISLRRMLGLFAFFYAFLHFATYVALDQFFDLTSITEDVAKRPYITAGFGAFVLLVPLAVTSTTTMIRRLGGRRWRLLHRLVYASALGGVAHYLWLVKADTLRPATYATILVILLVFRVWLALSARSTSDRLSPAPPGGLLAKSRVESAGMTCGTTRPS